MTSTYTTRRPSTAIGWRVGAALLGLVMALGWCGSAVAQVSWPSLEEPAAQGGGQQDAAVVIGIGDYFVAPDVAGAADNARDWYSHLVRGRGVPADRVTLLRDQEGTREKILRVFEQAAEKVGPEGTLWLIFVGHGAPAADGAGGVLVGVDAQNEAESLYARSVSHAELAALAARGRQARTVFVLDACFNGRTDQGAVLVPGLQPLVPVRDPGAAPGMLLFTASGADQFAGPLPGASRPAFSYLLLGALRGWADDNRDGAVTAAEALGYTRRALEATVRDRVQTPSLVAASPDTVLARGAMESGPELAAVVTGPRGGVPLGAPVADAMGRLRLDPADDGRYALSVMASDGQEHTCQAQGQPCILDLPQGPVVIRVRGDARVDQRLNLGREQVLMEVDGAAGWYGWASLLSIVGGMTTFGVGFSMAANSDDRSGLILALGGGTAFNTAAVVFGILWLLDKDEVKVDRTELRAARPQPPAVELDWGLGPGGAGLTLRW